MMTDLLGKAHIDDTGVGRITLICIMGKEIGRIRV
jgi:hypothetical protein